jgi:hypothetical protein
MPRRTPQAFRIMASLTCLLGAVFSTECGSPVERPVPVVSLSFDGGDSTGGLPPGLTSVNGILGKAAHFDGSPGCRLEAGPAGISSPATLSVWVRIERPREDFRLISRLDGDRDQTGTVRFKGCRVQAWNGDSWSDLVPFIAVNGSWQHLAIVFQDDGNAVGYVNGRRKGTAACGFDFAGVGFGVGAGFPATSGSPFAGSMDEFRIYDRALPADEIGRLYSKRLFDRAEREDGTALTPLGKIALKESAEPVRPGLPGVQPFWNGHSRRFIYAPAFDFVPIAGAKAYRFTVTGQPGGNEIRFESDAPTAALSPIWAEIPAGNVSLKVEGLDRPNGTPLGVSGTRAFIKSPPFNGPAMPRAYGYKECGIRSLSAQFQSRRFQMWLTENRPDPTCFYYGYPSKGMGAVISAMAYYATLSPEPKDAGKALVIARRAADFLINLTDKAPRPLAGWPPTYWNGLELKQPTNYPDNNMTFYPAEAAMSYLDLYDAVHDEKYFAAARAVADTYLRLQLEHGTWHQLIDAKTGEPAAPNLLVPTLVVEFFDRLKDDYGLTGYEAAREKAFRWLMTNPMRTYNWEAQFEDGRPKQPYENLSRQEATEMSILLFKTSGEHPEYLPMAGDLLRFAEDQFVIWDRRDALPGPAWAIPCALEQYLCYLPVSYSNHSMIRAYMIAHKYTANPMYHAKAVALANTLTDVDRHYGGGEIPTWLTYDGYEEYWINCAVYPSITLIYLDEALSGEP